MKGSPPGEGPKSFPYFFLLFLFLGLGLGAGIFPPESAAQKTEKDGLTRFDRLAEEAAALNKRGKFEEVLSLLQAHQGDPKNDSALFFNELGIAHRNKNQLQEAIRAYQKALSLDPENPVVMKNLGDAYYLNKDYDRAVEICRRALQSNPRFHQARSTLGLAYYRLGKYREAQEEFEAVLKTNPQDEQARNFREAARKKMQEKK